ncbi:PREDICTED: tetratricopeptide repeat protein 36 homolog [Nicrophorus vespilloides]|uniref:Tetratricopeptide repeat protein 36 homolog n=1 Tax=Nicrophorus vespilloides TaxID=110193 RepID=A0ABM1MEP9_NICVS|nr:PREDICTED: tetratricopeptide repeat protein 36 homolog [Nicrophorus vespilloides]
MSSNAELSIHDRAILNCVFNPSLPLDEAYNQEELNNVLKDDAEDFGPQTERIKANELEAIRRAENKEFSGALDLLNESIQTIPKKASLYNNRAQVYQFQGKFDDALNDLSKAIELAGDDQKKTLCQALSQRGLLHRKNDNLDEAREDFERAAQLGSKFARSQLVEINPYAALCNQMLRKVMDEFK